MQPSPPAEQKQPPVKELQVPVGVQPPTPPTGNVSTGLMPATFVMPGEDPASMGVKLTAQQEAFGLVQGR